MLNVDQLYRRDYDLPVVAEGARQTYMVASIPRSGSTYFVLRLWAAGAFGAPLEYVNMNTNRPVFNRVPNATLDEYWSQLQRIRTGRNGVFGYKMFIPNYREVSQREDAFLKRIAPDHVVYFTREDKAAQAVSYARAIQTKRWFAIAKEVNEPTYDFEFIHKQELSVIRQEAAWEQIFALTETAPLRVGYSEILNDEEGALDRIAAFMGVEYDRDRRIDIARLDRQSDSLNDEWIERYVAEKKQRGVNETLKSKSNEHAESV